MRESIIAHAPGTPLVIIRKDYLSICEGDDCAAALLSHAEFRTNNLLSEYLAQYDEDVPVDAVPSEALEFAQSNAGWRKDTLFQWGETVTTRALKCLVEWGYLTRREGLPGQNVPFWKVEIKTVQAKINAYYRGVRKSTGTPSVNPRTPPLRFTDTPPSETRTPPLKNTGQEEIYRRDTKDKEIKESDVAPDGAQDTSRKPKRSWRQALKEHMNSLDVPESLNEAWELWVNHVTSLQQQITPSATELHLRGLLLWSQGDQALARQIVEYSVSRNYRALFDPTDRIKNNGTSNNNVPPGASAQVQRPSREKGFR